MAKANTNAAGTKVDPADTTVVDAAKAGAATSGDTTGAQDGAGQGGTPPTDAVGAGAPVQLNTGAADAAGAPAAGAGEGGTPLADTAAQVVTVKLNVDTSAAAAMIAEIATAAADAKKAVGDALPAARQTLREAVGEAAAHAAKAGEHATHGVLNAIEVKLAELRNTIAASEGQVAEEYRQVLDWFENLL